MEMVVGGWRGADGENYEEGRWLVRGSGAACLEHLQIVHHEFHLICILVCQPSRPTHEDNIVRYRQNPALLHQIKNPYSPKSTTEPDVR